MLLAGLSAILSGCQTVPPTRHEGLSFGAGEAIAANTAMQMVDPWPWGVHRTDLAVPADREQYAPEDAAEEGQGAVNAGSDQSAVME